MTITVTKSSLASGVLLLFLATAASAGSINKSVKIAAGEESAGASSVNGSITVGKNAVVTGGVETVNGSIRVDDGAHIETAETVNGGLRVANNVQSKSLSTVNGAVKVGELSDVDGEVTAVNGRISVEKGTTIAETVSNVNGQIALSGVEVGGDVSTVTGDVNIVDRSVVKGDLIIEKPSNWGFGKSKGRKPRIVIGPGSTIAGTIKLEREVELFVSESASVGGVSGVMSMNEAVRFSGERP